MPTTLITGANRGIGLEFAKQYAADGWNVIATCRNPESASDLNDLAASSGGAVEVFALDAAMSSSVRLAAEKLAGKSIDLLLNNAGVMGEAKQSFGQVDYTDWAQVLNINTMGPLRVAEAFVEHVAASELKLIVTITSAMGSIADNTSGGMIIYRTSKAAVNMAMRSAAVDLAPRGISCVVMHPGWVKTDMGGSNALVQTTDSVAALREQIAKFGSDHSGKFINYDGREFPW